MQNSLDTKVVILVDKGPEVNAHLFLMYLLRVFITLIDDSKKTWLFANNSVSC